MPKGIGKKHIEWIEESEQQILKALEKYGKITWSNLVRKTGLSTSKLYKYLNRFEEEGKINKWYDESSGYPPKVYYELTRPGELTLQHYERLVKIGKLILKTKHVIKGFDVDEIDVSAKTHENWVTFPGKLYQGFKKEPDKYRGMVVPLKFIENINTKELSELIVYAIMPRKEIQDAYNKIQEKFPTEEEKKIAARKMFRSGLKAIKEAFENLLQEWKEEYSLE